MERAKTPKDLEVEVEPGTILKDEPQLFSFKVDKVVVNKKKIPLKTAETVVRAALKVRYDFEDFSHRENKEESFVAPEIPGFLNALHTAYDNHYPLKLSVSDFIVLIGQGLGQHIDANAEKLRKYFVEHEGKQEIEIFRDQFVRGKQNDWSTVFPEFAEQIKTRVKTDVYDVVIDDTSVATRDSRIVSEITLMDCMKSFFDYTVSTRCGIPEVTLEGTTDDWKKLKEKVRKLIEMNRNDCMELDWWLKHLSPVVDKICETGVTRKVDADFWSGIYKWKDPGSGTPYLNGWCTVFFPYLAAKKKAVFDQSKYAKITSAEFPKQVCEVPFIWKYLGTPIPMTFYGGFLGCRLNESDNTVSPTYFWCVVPK